VPHRVNYCGVKSNRLPAAYLILIAHVCACAPNKLSGNKGGQSVCVCVCAGGCVVSFNPSSRLVSAALSAGVRARKTNYGSRVSEISACYIDLDPRCLHASLSLCDLRRRGCESRVSDEFMSIALSLGASLSLTHSVRN
jgi:hypothetical protein